MLEIAEAGFCPVEFLGGVVAVVPLHSREEGLVVNNSIVLFVDVPKKILFLIISKGYNFINMFKPSFVSNEPTSNSIKFLKEIIIANLLFYSFFS